MHLREESSGKSMDLCWLMDSCQTGTITKFKNYTKRGWHTHQEQNLGHEKSIHVLRNKEESKQSLHNPILKSRYKFIFSYNTARFFLCKAAEILWSVTTHLHFSKRYKTLPVKRKVEYFFSSSARWSLTPKQNRQIAVLCIIFLIFTHRMRRSRYSLKFIAF